MAQVSGGVYRDVQKDEGSGGVSLEYDYPDDTPTREEMELAEADRDPPECICENLGAALYNPDCYWHGTEGIAKAEGC